MLLFCLNLKAWEYHVVLSETVQERVLKEEAQGAETGDERDETNRFRDPQEDIEYVY